MIRLCDDDLVDPASQPLAELLLRDLYTFGSPRVTLEDFTDVFAMAMERHNGSSWRIVSAGDPVALVPPVLVTDAKFIHLDKTWQVSENTTPEPVKSERNSHPRPPMPDIGTNMSYHSPFQIVFNIEHESLIPSTAPWGYFNSLYFAANPNMRLKSQDL